MNDPKTDHAVRRVLVITLVLNVCVAVAKFVFGTRYGVVSLQADGFHTLFDALSNVIGLVALSIATSPPDPEHPYGHRKVEVAASLVIGLMVLLGLFEVGRGIWVAAFEAKRPTIEPAIYGVVIATIVVNLGISIYERHEGKKYGSMILVSDSAHTMSDTVAASAVLVGIYLIDLGFWAADIIASLVVMTFIGMTAYRVLRNGLDVIVDTALVDAAVVREIAEADERVVTCHYVRSRGMPGHVHLEFHLSLDPDMSLADAGSVMFEVKQNLRERLPDLKDIIVQLEPHQDEHVNDVPENLL